MTTNKQKSKLTDIENKLVITSREREEGRGNIGVGYEEVQTTRYTINYNIYGEYSYDISSQL